jgi:ATP synthase protein I
MTIKPWPQSTADAENSNGVFDEDFKPMTAEEARQWRSVHPAMSPWRIVAWQLAIGAVSALVMGVWLGEAVGVSAAYGAFAVIFPAALMVRGLQRQRGVVQPGAAMLGFVIWESVKVLLTVIILLMAPKVVSSLNWLALVAGFVVTMKVYWVAAWLHSRQQSLNGLN